MSIDLLLSWHDINQREREKLGFTVDFSQPRRQKSMLYAPEDLKYGGECFVRHLLVYYTVCETRRRGIPCCYPFSEYLLRCKHPPSRSRGLDDFTNAVKLSNYSNAQINHYTRIITAFLYLHLQHPLSPLKPPPLLFLPKIIHAYHISLCRISSSHPISKNSQKSLDNTPHHIVSHFSSYHTTQLPALAPHPLPPSSYLSPLNLQDQYNFQNIAKAIDISHLNYPPTKNTIKTIHPKTKN